MQQSALNVRVLDMACEMIISQDEILQMCLNVLEYELTKQNCLPIIFVCPNSEEGEYYVICDIQESPYFSVVLGYFDGGFWSGVMYVESENLQSNAQMLEPLQEHFKAKNISLKLNAEECVFVESSVIKDLGFAEFLQKSLESLPANIALCEKLNAALSDFA